VPEYTVKFTSTPIVSEANGLLAEAVARGLLASLDHRFLQSIGNSFEAVYAVSDKGDVVGIITYTVLEFAESAQIQLIYVEESSRKLGVFSRLLSELRSHLALLGTKDIFIDVPGDQTVLADALEKRLASVATYRFAIYLDNEDGDGELLGQSGKKPA
jgi:hypothetical protein